MRYYFISFYRVIDPELLKCISGMNKTTCSSDPLHVLEWKNAIFSLEPYFVFKSKDVSKYWQCLLLRLDEIFRSRSI